MSILLLRFNILISCIVLLLLVISPRAGQVYLFFSEKGEMFFFFTFTGIKLTS